MLRLIPGTFIGTSIVRKKAAKVPPLKRGMEVGSPNRNSRRQMNLMVTDVFTKIEHSLVPLLEGSAPFMEEIVVT